MKTRRHFAAITIDSPASFGVEGWEWSSAEAAEFRQMSQTRRRVRLNRWANRAIIVGSTRRKYEISFTTREVVVMCVLLKWHKCWLKLRMARLIWRGSYTCENGALWEKVWEGSGGHFRFTNHVWGRTSERVVEQKVRSTCSRQHRTMKMNLEYGLSQALPFSLLTTSKTVRARWGIHLGARWTYCCFSVGLCLLYLFECWTFRTIF